jgi:tight adherence protein C
MSKKEVKKVIPVFIGLLIMASSYFLFYQFLRLNREGEKVHLPSQILTNEIDQIQLPLKSDDYLFKNKKPWLPLTNKLKVYDNKIKVVWLRRNLIKAGSPMGIFEFLAFKLLGVIGLPIIGALFLSSFFPLRLTIFLSAAVGFLLPDIWLREKIKRRQQRIRRDLPNMIDLLNLCVSGGLDFMLAVNRAVKDLSPCDLTAELAEVYHETQMGKSRREALKNFAWRVDTPEVYTFVRTLIQAERMGVPISDTLKVQAEEMRMRRYLRGETLALKAPIKLLLPLFLFILPAVLIIVAGPILLQFMRTNIGF